MLAASLRSRRSSSLASGLRQVSYFTSVAVQLSVLAVRAEALFTQAIALAAVAPVMTQLTENYIQLFALAVGADALLSQALTPAAVTAVPTQLFTRIWASTTSHLTSRAIQLSEPTF